MNGNLNFKIVKCCMFLLFCNIGDLVYFGFEWVFDKNVVGVYLFIVSDLCIVYILFMVWVKELEFRFNFYLYLLVKNYMVLKWVM